MNQILQKDYDSKRVRYYVYDTDKVIFNAADLYRILNINEPIEQPDQDLAGAVLLATSNVPFMEWLMLEFEGSAKETLLSPGDLKWE